MMYFGTAPAVRMARPRKARVAAEVGTLEKTAKPITRREKWSITTATHQQNGQRWGSAKGSQEVQNPEPIGIVVRSTCHTWLGRLAVTRRSTWARAGSWVGPGCRRDSRTI